jgi:hypothetical protein
MDRLRLADRDIDFLVDTVSPGTTDKLSLKQILLHDADFRRTYITDEAVFKKVIGDDQVLLKISPTLLFEILLRKAVKDLKASSYTFEADGSLRIPVFDAKEVVALFSQDAVLVYLADMLSSFTKITSYSISFRTRKRIWRKIRFNDMDVPSLMSFCDVVADEYKYVLYKRIADVCLFMTGVFPEYIAHDFRYPLSGEIRPNSATKTRTSPKEYEERGKKFYRLAAEHETAAAQRLSEVFWSLHREFVKAKKPLNFMSEHYLHYQKHQWFG